MENIFFLAFLALIVLICDVASAGYKSSSNDESNSRTAAIVAKKSACTNNAAECRRNLTLKNQNDLYGNRKRESGQELKNDKKTKQSVPMKPQITDVTKRKAEFKRRLIRPNKHVKSSNASRIMPGSKLQKIQHQRQMKNKFKANSVKNYGKNRQNPTARRPLNGKSGKMPGRYSAKKTPIFLYSKKKKICMPFNGPTELGKGLIKFKTFKECVVKSKAKHGGNPAAIYTCWFRKKKNRCKTMKKKKPCNTYTKIRHYFHTKKKCLSSTIYIYNRNTMLCEVVKKSTILSKTKKIYDTFARCVSNIYKKFGTNATGNFCWRKNTAGNCQKIRLQNTCESLSMKLYRSEKDCKDALKSSSSNKCYVQKTAKGVCQMEETVNKCSDHGSNGYYETMQSCTNALKPKDVCYVPKVEEGVCVIEQTENGKCSNDGSSSGYYATMEKCINRTFEQCFKYDLSDKECHSVNVKLGSGCVGKNLFAKRDDCRNGVEINCYKFNWVLENCVNITSKNKCDQTKGEFEDRTKCLATKKLCYKFDKHSDACQEAYRNESICDGIYTNSMTECKKANTQVECFKWNDGTKLCQKVIDKFCDNHVSFNTTKQCEDSVPKINCYKFSPVLEKCNVVKVTHCNQTRGDYEDETKCLATKKQCYRLDSVSGECRMVHRAESICDFIYFNTMQECENTRESQDCYKLNKDATACEQVITYGECYNDKSPYLFEDNCLSKNALKKCYVLDTDKNDCEKDEIIKADVCDSSDNRYEDKYECESHRKERVCFEFTGYKCVQNSDNFQECNATTNLFVTEEECLKHHNTSKCYKYDSYSKECEEIFVKGACSLHKYTSSTQSDCKNNIPHIKCFARDESTCRETIIHEDCDEKINFVERDSCINFYGFVKCYVANVGTGVCSEKYIDKDSMCYKWREEYDDMDSCKSAILRKTTTSTISSTTTNSTDA